MVRSFWLQLEILPQLPDCGRQRELNQARLSPGRLSSVTWGLSLLGPASCEMWLQLWVVQMALMTSNGHQPNGVIGFRNEPYPLLRSRIKLLFCLLPGKHVLLFVLSKCVIHKMRQIPNRCSFYLVCFFLKIRHICINKYRLMCFALISRNV